MERLPGLGCHADGQRGEVSLIGCRAVKARRRASSARISKARKSGERSRRTCVAHATKALGSDHQKVRTSPSKKGDAVASPFQGSRGRGKNVCCTAASRRKFRTSAAPKIDNTAGRGAPCERAIFLRHNPLANAGEGQYTRLVFPPPVPPTAVRPATVPPATVAPATVVATPPVVMRPPVVMAPPPVVIMPVFRTF